MGDRNAVFEGIEWDLAQLRHHDEAEHGGGEKRIATGRRFHDRLDPQLPKLRRHFRRRTADQAIVTGGP